MTITIQDALLLAVQSKRPSSEIEELILRGGDVNYKNNAIVNPMPILIEVAGTGDVECLELFIKHGAKINSSDRFGITALHTAAWNNLTECVKSLVKNGANINQKTTDGNTALHLVAAENNANLLAYLIENNADYNMQNDCGNTPLYIAANHAAIECLSVLLGKEADTTLVNNQGITAMERAQEQDIQLAIQLFTAHDEKMKLSERIVGSNNEENNNLLL